MKNNLEPLKDALEELADFVRKMDPAEYSYFYRLVERMGNNIEICYAGAGRQVGKAGEYFEKGLESGKADV